HPRRGSDPLNAPRVLPTRIPRPQRGPYTHPRGHPRERLEQRGEPRQHRQLPHHLAAQEDRCRLGLQADPHGPRHRLCAEEAVILALRRSSSFSKIDFEGQPIRLFTRPLSGRGNPIGAIQVARESGELDTLWRSQLWTLAIFLPAALFVAAVGAFFLTNRAM